MSEYGPVFALDENGNGPLFMMNVDGLVSLYEDNRL